MIILSPYARVGPDVVKNAKNYPYWDKVVKLLKDYHIVQVGIAGEEKIVEDVRYDLSLEELKTLILECETWMSVDSFFQHYAWSLNKPGVVVFSKSDPNIFGHRENINVLKDRKYLRPDQFGLWKDCPYDKNAFVAPEKVVEALNFFLKK